MKHRFIPQSGGPLSSARGPSDGTSFISLGGREEGTNILCSVRGTQGMEHRLQSLLSGKSKEET